MTDRTLFIWAGLAAIAAGAAYLLFSSRNQRVTSASETLPDLDAMERDWRAVGQDLQIAMERHEREVATTETARQRAIRELAGAGIRVDANAGSITAN